MSNGNGNVLGEVLLGVYVVNKVADKHQTKKDARAEGITYTEMKLRKMAAEGTRPLACEDPAIRTRTC